MSMNDLLCLMGFLATMVTGAGIAVYILFELLIHVIDKIDDLEKEAERELMVTKDGEKIIYNEDDQE